MEIADHIYQRSVIKQLGLTEESRHLFQKNAYSVSIGRNEGKGGCYAEASELLVFGGNSDTVITADSLTGIRRKLMCAGGSLKEIRAEIVFSGSFDEAALRKLSISLKRVSDELSFNVARAAVHVRDGKEPDVAVTLLGRGELKDISEASWQNQIILPGQDVIVTGKIGRAGLVKLFREKRGEFEKAFPKIYIERIGSKFADRLPFIETETALFYGVTAMYPCGSGGILAGLWNLGRYEGAGMEIEADRLYCEQEVVETAEYFDLDPLKMDSEGVYILTSFMGEELVYALRKAGIDAVSAGKVIKDKKRVIRFNEEERFIDSPRYI